MRVERGSEGRGGRGVEGGGTGYGELNKKKEARQRQSGKENKQKEK